MLAIQITLIDVLPFLLIITEVENDPILTGNKPRGNPFPTCMIMGGKVIGKNGIPFHTHTHKREKQTAASFQNMFFGATCPQASNHIAQKGHSNEGVFMCACVCSCLTLTKSSKVLSCYEQPKNI